jgi:DNA-binding MarR family transcriptional regulator
VERDILQSLDKPVAISDLLAVGDKVGIDRKAVVAALDSLQRRGLVDLT